MRKRLRRAVARGRSEAGSALVEFAVSLPFLVLMLAAGTGTVMIVQTRFAVQAAAREAATIGSYVGTNIDPYDTAIAEARSGAERVLLDHGLDLSRATITFDGTSTGMERASLFHVQIEYVLELPIPLARYLGRSEGQGTGFSMRSVAVLPVQQYKARWPCPSDDPICH